MMQKILTAGIRCLRNHGLGYTIIRGWEKVTEHFLKTYDKQWRKICPKEGELREQRNNQPNAGLISIVVPVYNTEPRLLMEMAQSFVAQTYQKWEACLYDASNKPETREMLKQVEQLDTRIHVMYSDINEGLSGNTNRAIEMATGEWIALCDHDDLYTPDALWRVADCIVRQQPDVIYTDEDKITEDSSYYTDPNFKPDFLPDDINSGNYVCHLMVMRRSLVNTVGGLDPAFDGSQDHNLILQLSEHTKKIVHLPFIAYHWRSVGTSMSHQKLEQCLQAACRAVEEHNNRIGLPCKVYLRNGMLRVDYEIKGTPLVTVIGAKKPKLDWDAIQFLPYQGSCMDYAAINHLVEKKAKGQFILFLDSSVQNVQPDLLREMLMYAQRDNVGAVTPLMKNAVEQVTHAGFVIGRQLGAVCRQRGVLVHMGGYHLMLGKVHNVSAISPVCWMVRRDHFIPFDETYQSALGMVDWCLKQQKAGRYQVLTPWSKVTCENKEALLLSARRNNQDLSKLRDTWGDMYDPCYNAQVDHEKGNYRLCV